MCVLTRTQFGGFLFPARRTVAITSSWLERSRIIARAFSRPNPTGTLIHLGTKRWVAGRRSSLNLRRHILRAPLRMPLRSSDMAVIQRRASSIRLRAAFLGWRGRTFRFTARGFGLCGPQRRRRRGGKGFRLSRVWTSTCDRANRHARRGFHLGRKSGHRRRRRRGGHGIRPLRRRLCACGKFGLNFIIGAILRT